MGAVSGGDVGFTVASCSVGVDVVVAAGGLCKSGVAAKDVGSRVCDRCKSANLKAGNLLGL